MKKFIETYFEHLCIVALTFLLVYPALFVKGTLIGEGVDLYGTIWFYEWIYDSIHNGTDPSHTTLFFHPFGKDIFGHTGNNFIDALMAAPFIAIFGFPRYQPIFYACLILLNGFAFRALGHQLFQTTPARLGSTLLFMLSPYCLGELILGRPTQCFMAFTVLSIYYFLKMNRDGGYKYAILSGVFAALQGWTYWFGGYFLGFALIWIVIAEWRTERIKEYCASLSSCIALIAPALVSMLMKARSGEVPGLANAKEAFWSIPVPQPNNVFMKLAGYQITEPAGMKFFWHYSIAIPLLFAIFRSKRRKLWLGLLLVSLAIATGPVFFWGQQEYPMFHYILMYRILPFFSRLWFPYRMISIALLAGIIGIGFWLDQQKKYVWPMVITIVGLNLWEQSDLYKVPLLNQKWDYPKMYEEMAPYDGAIIELPIGYVRESILWQAVHKRPTFGGMGENLSLFHTPEHKARLKKPLYRYLRKIVFFPHRDFEPPSLDLALREGFRFVVLDRRIVSGIYMRNGHKNTEERLEQLIQRLNDLFGQPWLEEDAYLVWNIGKSLPNSTRLPVTGAKWEKQLPSKLEQRLLDLNRLLFKEKRGDL
ncbi:MAG: glycosyltransferase family 39 protein [Myxococcota bacterium]|nr:glycosyltransferase family 39 protein [Myxococcota bacterium]